MTGKSPAVLEVGAVQNPKWKREVDAETGGRAFGTKISKDLLICNRLEDKKRQLILKNQELKEEVTKLRASIVKADATKTSKDLLRCNRLEDKKRQLIQKNQELREEVTKLRALIVKADEEIPKLLKAHEVERSKWEDDNKKLDDDIAEMARLLNSVETPKK